MHREETVLAVGMAEAARRLGLSARTVATLVLRHELPSRKVGRRRIIPVVALEAFVRSDQDSGRIRPAKALQGSSGGTG
jgi:excisionase family DNA binding protein